MPTVLVTGLTVMQNSPISSLAVAITITCTHFTYQWRDDQAQLGWVAWLNTKQSPISVLTRLNVEQLCNNTEISI